VSLSARKIARGAINLIGVAAGLGGLYFLYDTGSVLSDLASLSRGLPHNRGSLAAPAGMLVSGVFLLEILVFGALTVVLLGISAWALEPRRRWREWRANSRNHSALKSDRYD
jgi:hypothetical protein